MMVSLHCGTARAVARLESETPDAGASLAMGVQPVSLVADRLRVVRRLDLHGVQEAIVLTATLERHLYDSRAGDRVTR